MTFPGSALGRLAVGDTFVTPPVSWSSKLALFISWCPSPNTKNQDWEGEGEKREESEIEIGWFVILPEHKVVPKWQPIHLLGK